MYCKWIHPRRRQPYSPYCFGINEIEVAVEYRNLGSHFVLLEDYQSKFPQTGKFARYFCLLAAEISPIYFLVLRTI
jgi:hypothetical protein